jgi:hypothetical protein
MTLCLPFAACFRLNFLTPQQRRRSEVIPYYNWKKKPTRKTYGESTMTHVSLDTEDEAVKQFVLGLTADANGAVLELNGQPVACLVPPPKAMNGDLEPEWTDTKNTRRIELIKKKHASGLSPSEHVELAGLQNEMLRFRQKVAPLPLEHARHMHQELLAHAAAQKSPK